MNKQNQIVNVYWWTVSYENIFVVHFGYKTKCVVCKLCKKN